MRKPHLVARAVGSLTALVVFCGHSLAAAATPDESLTAAAQLVEQALRSEVSGDADQRATLLKRALEQNPNYAPARWHSGFVKVDDNWLSLDEAASRAAADPQLAAYRKRRDALVDTADNQREMARWCAKHKLTDEARIHWAKALEFDPQDAEALAGLGVEFYQGQLLTKSQMIEAKKRAGERIKAARELRPQLVKWRKAIESGNAKRRSDAFQSLRQLNDVDALELVESVLAENRDSEVARELNRAVVDTVARFPVPLATQILIRRAMLADSEPSRALACAELKKRPVRAYMPQFLPLIPGKSAWQFNYVVDLLPSGQAVLRTRMFREIDGTKYECTAESVITSPVYFKRPKNEYGLTPGQARELSTSLAQERQIAAGFQREDEQRQQQKTRAVRALQLSTGFTELESAEEWANKWTEISETYSPPRLESRPESIRHHFYVQRTVASCFPAGTPVLTASGPRQIESIKVGDRVLTQDVVTGELAYKPVQATTLRPPAPLVRLNMEGRTLQATRGHWFWVVGQGWQMAKDLKPGDRLHAMQGAALIASIDQDPPAEAYNLVVSDNHNYFVGEVRVLAHDNVTPEETPVSVPGLAAVKVSETSTSTR